MNDEQLCIRTYGSLRSTRIGLRLDQMEVAATLAQFIQVHPRCHPLKGDRSGTWSADLDHPYRLIFEPADDPLPMTGDGGLAVDRVLSVRIVMIDDTH